MNIVFDELSANQIYHLMTQTIIPRPVAWVLTESPQQILNLAPFSYFTPLSSSPPLLMISVGKKPNGDKKDTVVNANATNKLVVHIASVGSSEAMTATAATLEYDQSEIEANALELTPFEGFALPRLSEAKVAFGCELVDTIEIGDTPQTLLIMQVNVVHIDDELIDITDGKAKVYAEKLDPISRLGLGEYAGLTAPFTVSRPK
ncbi:flavin reductase [Neiella marina]|uniref:Flavin reductase n=1 Tax=Neiella marina TaxID=508461 RepID=A0A8J2U5L3_9GAMM|nr:flavin reductase family protein [Neiella marina]GGA79316.1 flavin reductase [Neiella marina]